MSEVKNEDNAKFRTTSIRLDWLLTEIIFLPTPQIKLGEVRFVFFFFFQLGPQPKSNLEKKKFGGYCFQVARGSSTTLLKRHLSV